MDSIIWMYDRGNCGHEGFLIMGRLTPINEGVTIPFRGELPMFWPWHAWRPCSVMQLRGPIMAATGQTLALTLSKCWAQTFDQPPLDTRSPPRATHGHSVTSKMQSTPQPTAAASGGGLDIPPTGGASCGSTALSRGDHPLHVKHC